MQTTTTRVRADRSRARRHVYIDPEAEATLRVLRRQLPGASSSELFRAGLFALAERIGERAGNLDSLRRASR